MALPPVPVLLVLSLELIRLEVDHLHADAEAQKQKEELLSTIKEEFADVSSIFVASNLIGVLGKCYLGDTYDVHTLDISGIMIIEHYKSNQKLPNGFESARSLCQHPQYEFIEVYEKFMIAVMSDGSTAVISK